MRDIVYPAVAGTSNLMRALDIEDNIEHLRYRSNFITRQRRRVGDLGENVAEVFGAATFGASPCPRAGTRLVWPCFHRYILPVSTVEKIKMQIESLSPEERSELERMLREPRVEAPKAIVLPDQAARRKRIFGDKVLPNYVLLAREGAI